MKKLKTRMIMENQLIEEVQKYINSAKEINENRLAELGKTILNDIPKMSDAMLIFWIGRFIENK